MNNEQVQQGINYPTDAHGGIPAFHSIEEEATFWDTHDTTEFEEAFIPVEVRFAKNLSGSSNVEG